MNLMRIFCPLPPPPPPPHAPKNAAGDSAVTSSPHLCPFCPRSSFILRSQISRHSRRGIGSWGRGHVPDDRRRCFRMILLGLLVEVALVFFANPLRSLLALLFLLHARLRSLSLDIVCVGSIDHMGFLRASTSPLCRCSYWDAEWGWVKKLGGRTKGGGTHNVWHCEGGLAGYDRQKSGQAAFSLNFTYRVEQKEPQLNCILSYAQS